jgi:alpha-1,2-mannosyltransferase
MRTIQILLSLIAFVSLLVILKPLTYNSYPDFSSYYYGVETLMTGRNPYIGGENMMMGPFLYPPFGLLFFFPFTLTSFFMAQKIFTAVSLVCFFTSIYLLYKLFNIRLFTQVGLSTLILLFNFFPLKFTLGMGQINNVVLLSTVLFIYFYVRQKDYWAGIALAFALSLKLFPALLMLYLIIERKWKIFFTTITTGLVLLAATFLFIDRSVFVYFFTTTMPDLLGSWSYAYYNQSLTGFLGRTGDEMTGNTLRVLIGTILLFVSLFVIIKSKKVKLPEQLLCVGILLTINLIINSIAWQHHFAWAIIPLLITFYYIRERNFEIRYYLVLGLSYVLIALNLANPASVPVVLQSHVFYGITLLYFLQIYLLKAG